MSCCEYLPSALEKPFSEVHVTTSKDKAYTVGQSNLVSDWNQVLHWLSLILEDRAESFFAFPGPSVIPTQ